MQYFIRNTSMVVTHIEGSGSGARVYVVGFFFSAVSEVCLFVFKLEVIDMGGGGVFLIIPGDGTKDPEQHPHGLPTHRAPQHHGPRHRLLQALLLRGHHHRQPYCHACAHDYVSRSISSSQKSPFIMLTLNDRFINVSMSLPKTSYVKMVDVWLLFTLLIPFLEVCALHRF